MNKLILIGNDDGYQAKGLRTLVSLAREMGEVVVVSTEMNASAKSMSLTTDKPLHAKLMTDEPGLKVYATNGTPADSIKLGLEHLCPRMPDLMLSGINHGSNASINVLYSGTMGAALEAAVNGVPALGFSILNFEHDVDFGHCESYIRGIIAKVLEVGLPEGVCLNVNFPYAEQGPIKGLRVCRAAKAVWHQTYVPTEDPRGHKHYWMAGEFRCHDMEEDTDQWALEHGYASIVPLRPDYTAHDVIDNIKEIL